MKITRLCLTVCNPTDYTVYGILQARILEWVAIPFSRGSSQPRDQTQVSCIAGWFLTSWATYISLILHVCWGSASSSPPHCTWAPSRTWHWVGHYLQYHCLQWFSKSDEVKTSHFWKWHTLLLLTFHWWKPVTQVSLSSVEQKKVWLFSREEKLLLMEK